MQEIEVWSYEQMAYTQLRIFPGEWDEQTSLGFLDTNGSSNLCQTTRPCNNKKNKKKIKKIKEITYKIMDFPVPADNIVKLKER